MGDTGEGEKAVGDQAPGMPDAICHACGLGRRCANQARPNGETGIDIHLTIGTSNAMGASWGHEPAPPQRRCKAWVDDPWSAMTTGEADAWRAGWEAAKAQAVKALRDSAASWGRDAFRDEAYAVRMVVAISSMDPPA